MQLQHIFAARGLMQAVDVLRDDSRQLSFRLQMRQGFMRRIRARVGREHFLPVKCKELLRALHEKGMADNCFRRITPFLSVKSIRAAKVRNAAFC